MAHAAVARRHGREFHLAGGEEPSLVPLRAAQETVVLEGRHGAALPPRFCNWSEGARPVRLHQRLARREARRAFRGGSQGLVVDGSAPARLPLLGRRRLRGQEAVVPEARVAVAVFVAVGPQTGVVLPPPRTHLLLQVVGAPLRPSVGVCDAEDVDMWSLVAWCFVSDAALLQLVPLVLRRQRKAVEVRTSAALLRDRRECAGSSHDKHSAGDAFLSPGVGPVREACGGCWIVAIGTYIGVGGICSDAKSRWVLLLRSRES